MNDTAGTADTQPVRSTPPTAHTPQPVSPGAATAVAERPTYASEPAAVAAGKRSLRDRVISIPRAAVLSAVATFVVVAVGFGGFAIGRATAPDGAVQPAGVSQDGGPGSFRGPDGGGQQGFPGGPGQQQGGSSS